MEHVQIVIQVFFADGTYWHSVRTIAEGIFSFQSCLELKQTILSTQQEIVHHDIRCLINGVEPYGSHT